jgi:hypothetical protein
MARPRQSARENPLGEETSVHELTFFVKTTDKTGFGLTRTDNGHGKNTELSFAWRPAAAAHARTGQICIQDRDRPPGGLSVSAEVGCSAKLHQVSLLWRCF